MASFKRLYQEAGVSLWVVWLPSASQCVRHYDVTGVQLIPQVHLLVIGMVAPEANGMRILPAFGGKSP